MKSYSNIISLTRNARGIYCLDTSIGCTSGMAETEGGCYGDCYAAKAAKRYGKDFSKTVLRNFENKKHERETVLKISRIKMPFIRIGCSGDPSEDWAHTLNIIKAISNCNKEIVIITRHWTLLTDEQLEYIKTLNICINTSVSALDRYEVMQNSLDQYHRLKPFCKSVLRIISCDFNLENQIGLKLSQVQHNLFKNESTIDTVFRPDKNSKWISEGIINVMKAKFMNGIHLVSKLNKKTYLGKCGSCKEMCGINIKNSFLGKRKIVKQLSLI